MRRPLGLAEKARPYQVAEEGRLWDLKRVDRFLALGVYHRTVNARGAISMYGWPHQVGRAHKGREVFVRFDPGERQWVVSDHQGTELRRMPADDLSPKRVRDLRVGCGRHM